MTRATRLLLAALTPLLVAAGLTLATSPASAVAYGGYTDWKAISAGGSHTCGIRTTGQLYCWGTDGTGSALYSLSGYRDWKSVSVGTSHRCAIRGTGYLFCWGSDASGQLGNGDFGNASTPVRVGSSADWRSVSAGASHTCGVRGTGLLYCWGSDSDGQLGNAGGGDATAPQPILPTLTNWTSVSAGGLHTCATRGAGTLYCWGSDSSGQLGNGGAGNWTSPASITKTYDWKQVTTGTAHSCAIRGTGAMYCWGSDSYGQLGNGTGGSQTSPARTTNAADWKLVSAGGTHTCAIRGTGALYCWGNNDGHQTSESGTGGFYTSPVRYPNIYDWKIVDAGARHTCAIRSSGRIYCWGVQKAPSNGTPAGTAYPAQLSSVGYLKAWKVTLPYDGSDPNTYADEIKQPTLATYRSLSYFHTNSNNTAVVLRAPVGGAKTEGSTYARTELRNMYPYTSGDAKSYNWTSGTHVLEINEAFTHLPTNKPSVVGVQIHDPDHQVLMIRLDGQRLYAQNYVSSTNHPEVNLNTAYKLGTRFNVKVTANSSGIFVDYNGVRKAFWNRHATSAAYWYFKAGCYLHSNTTYDAPNEYGEVLIYSLKVTHS